LEDIVSKGFDPLAFRLKILQSHYRSKVNFTWESLEAAQNLLNSLRAWADQKHQKAAYHKEASEPYADGYRAMLQAAEDDLNMPEALRALTDLAGKSETDGVDPEKFQSLLNLIDRLFGLQLAGRPDITHAQKDLVAEREQARGAKDWQKSDDIRDKLKQQGIAVRDTAGGPVWYRV
jgi:cysteinyl-tRNA synthetase